MRQVMPHFSPMKIGVIIAIYIADATFNLPSLSSRAQVAHMPDWLAEGQTALAGDLQGGAELLLEIRLDDAIEKRLGGVVDDIERSLSSRTIEYRDLHTRGDNVAFTLVEPGKVSEALEILKTSNGDAITPDFEFEEAGDGRIKVKLTVSAVQSLQDSVIDQSMTVARRRIDQAGIKQAIVQRHTSSRILVELPEEGDLGTIKNLLEQSAKLSFHLVDKDTSVAEAIAGSLPASSMLLPNEDSSSPSQIVVRKRIEVGGEHVIDAQPTYRANAPVVSVTFDSVGAQKFGNISKEHVGARLAIVLDKRVISSPRIIEPILGSNGIISGNFSIQSMNELAILLRTGALPVPLTVVEVRSGGPQQ